MRKLIAFLWQREFLWRLSRQTGRRITVRDITWIEKTLPAAQMPGTDPARHFNLTLARSLHAAVVLLEDTHKLSRDDARATAKTAFLATGSWVSRWAVRLWLWLERDPFEDILKRGAAGAARDIWGDGMEVEDRRGSGEVSLCVTRCPFSEYFWNASRMDLAPILCAWDASWIDRVNASPAPIGVALKCTLVTGAESCQFVFRDLSVPQHAAKALRSSS